MRLISPSCSYRVNNVVCVQYSYVPILWYSSLTQVLYPVVIVIAPYLILGLVWVLYPIRYRLFRIPYLILDLYNRVNILH